jgi:DNA polymerase II small subunit/DNA polymerase delta subunit B
MKRILIGVIVLALLGGGAYFYFAKVAHTPIASILKDPRKYDGKDITIAGEVTDKTSLFVVKYFRLKDRTGDIVVVTKRTLPSVGSKVRVKGRVEEAFSLGSEQMLVFVEGEDSTGQ